VSLIAMLVSGLRMLLCAGSVLLALGMVTLAMMFSGGTMRLGSIFVVFGCLVVFVSCHLKPRLFVSLPAGTKPPIFELSLQLRRTMWIVFTGDARFSVQLSFKNVGSQT
jgi:hypothetical protein